MIDSGVRPAFVSSQYAARMIIGPGRGLIVNIFFWAARKYIGNIIYGIAKPARMQPSDTDSPTSMDASHSRSGSKTSKPYRPPGPPHRPRGLSQFAPSEQPAETAWPGNQKTYFRWRPPNSCARKSVGPLFPGGPAGVVSPVRAHSSAALSHQKAADRWGLYGDAKFE